jgi:hypothetical protein
MHVPRRRRQTTQSTAYTATRHWQPGRHTYVYGAAAMRAIPVPGLPDSSIRARGRGRGGACLERRACIALHASCMALSPRARELPARTAAARPASGRAARAAGPGLVRCICMAWTPGRRGQLLLCLQQRAGGRPRAEQRAFVWIGGFSFLTRGIQRSFSDPVCSDE